MVVIDKIQGYIFVKKGDFSAYYAVKQLFLVVSRQKQDIPPTALQSVLPLLHLLLMRLQLMAQTGSCYTFFIYDVLVSVS